jgi:hypothetical protein
MSRDPWPNLRPGISDVGKRLAPITPGASDFANASLIYASVGGNVTYIPEQNLDAEAVIETVTQGWVSPVLVRRVTSATATLHQIVTR